MKGKIFLISLFATSLAQAQVLYVNNSDDTYQTIDTKQTHEITFNEAQQLVKFTMLNGITSQFATTRIDNISPVKEKTTELVYNQNPSVAFDANDANSYNEITRGIPTDELDDEYGDFVENFASSKVITITFSENSVKTSTLPTGITSTINNGHLTIYSTIGKVAYRVTGTSSNGSLKIYSDKKFRILANMINLTNPTGPAITSRSTVSIVSIKIPSTP